MNNLAKELRKQGYNVETPLSFTEALKESLKTFWITRLWRKYVKKTKV